MLAECKWLSLRVGFLEPSPPLFSFVVENPFFLLPEPEHIELFCFRAQRYSQSLTFSYLFSGDLSCFPFSFAPIFFSLFLIGRQCGAFFFISQSGFQGCIRSAEFVLKAQAFFLFFRHQPPPHRRAFFREGTFGVHATPGKMPPLSPYPPPRVPFRRESRPAISALQPQETTSRFLTPIVFVSISFASSGSFLGRAELRPSARAYCGLGFSSPMER